MGLAVDGHYTNIDQQPSTGWSMIIMTNSEARRECWVHVHFEWDLKRLLCIIRTFIGLIAVSSQTDSWGYHGNTTGLINQDEYIIALLWAIEFIRNIYRVF